MPLFRRNKSRGQSGSSDVASERLRLVLAHDRANLPPGLLETLKDEIVEVIAVLEAGKRSLAEGREVMVAEVLE